MWTRLMWPPMRTETERRKAPRHATTSLIHSTLPHFSHTVYLNPPVLTHCQHKLPDADKISAGILKVWVLVSLDSHFDVCYARRPIVRRCARDPLLLLFRERGSIIFDSRCFPREALFGSSRALRCLGRAKSPSALYVRGVQHGVDYSPRAVRGNFGKSV